MNDILYRVKGRSTKIIGGLRGNLIEAFWFIKVLNAGDLVTPFLLKQYGFTPVHSWPPVARMIGCGSVLRHLDEDYDGYILGSGFLRDGPPLPLLKARVLAVRGIFSRDRIGAPKSTPLGDPGLLMAKFITTDLPKNHTLGILPHYFDKSDPRSARILNRYPNETKFIDIQTSPQKVMQEIAQCQYILSSSLHGCIFADSLKIPVIWMGVTGREAERNYKFSDYCSIFSKELTPSQLSGNEPLTDILAMASSPTPNEVDQTIGVLDQAFLKLKYELLGK
jgi:pyruvyltransferase